MADHNLFEDTNTPDDNKSKKADKVTVDNGISSFCDDEEANKANSLSLVDDLHENDAMVADEEDDDDDDDQDEDELFFSQSDDEAESILAAYERQQEKEQASKRQLSARQASTSSSPAPPAQSRTKATNQFQLRQ